MSIPPPPQSNSAKPVWRDEFPVIFVSPELTIRTFTSKAAELFGLSSTDVGQPLTTLNRQIESGGFQNWVTNALANDRIEENELQDRKGYWYSVRIQPHKPQPGSIFDGALVTFVDIDEMKRASERQEYSELIINTVREPLVVLDSQLRVKMASRSFYHLFHMFPKETENKLLHELGDGQWNIPALRRLLEAILPQKKVFNNFEIDHHFQHIGRRILYLNAREIRKTGQPLILLAMEDATERRLAEMELDKKNVELNRSNADLQQFANFAAHDLQAPVSRILSFGDLLEKKSDVLDEETRKYLDHIRRSARRMKMLIDDLLAFAKVTHQEAPFEDLDLNGILQDVLADLEPHLLKCQAKIEAAGLPIVRGKRYGMYQLFLNLLTNAIKYRKKGLPPLVQVSSRRVADKTVEVRITDNGIGFDMKDVDRIFKPFNRLHASKDYAGTGIGLAVCKKVMEDHGGHITATSRVGEGSTFIFTLPSID